jgi:hypothetical protein
MTVGEWLEWAKAGALQRGMPDLIAPLEGLAQATERLRAADWNDDPSTPPSQASLRASAASDVNGHAPEAK